MKNILVTGSGGIGGVNFVRALRATDEKFFIVGTDFNPDGFERIGPKTALKLIKEYGKLEDIPQIQDQLKQIEYNQIRDIFLHTDVTEVGKIEFKDADYSEIVNYLANERNFSRERVQTSVNRLKQSLVNRSHTLEQWF